MGVLTMEPDVRVRNTPAVIGPMPVKVEGAEVAPTGLRVLRVSVADESDGDPDGAASVARMLERWDAELAALADAPRPLIHRTGVDRNSLNPVAARLYASAGMSSWASRLRSGGALVNPLLPGLDRLVGLDRRGGIVAGPELSEQDRRLFLHSLDGRAARARARVQQWLAGRTLIDVNRPQAWTSVGCATALPVAGALSAAGGSGVEVTATFLDTCGDARELTRRALDRAGVEPTAHRILDWRMAARVGIDGVVGEESQDLVDVVAAIDLLGDARAVRMLRQSYAAVRPGGVLLFAVTRRDRPLRDLVERGIGWAGSHLRGPEDIAHLLAAAGIDVRDAMAYLTPEGVHAVVEVRKL